MSTSSNNLQISNNNRWANPYGSNVFGAGVYLTFNCFFIIIVLIISIFYRFKGTSAYLVFFNIFLLIILACCIGEFLLLNKYKKIDQDIENNSQATSSWYKALLAFAIINIIIIIITCVIAFYKTKS